MLAWWLYLIPASPMNYLVLVEKCFETSHSWELYLQQCKDSHQLRSLQSFQDTTTRYCKTRRKRNQTVTDSSFKRMIVDLNFTGGRYHSWNLSTTKWSWHEEGALLQDNPGEIVHEWKIKDEENGNEDWDNNKNYK